MENSDRFAPRQLAGWFKPAAIASVVFMALGTVTYISHVTTNPASLPLDQRQLFAAEPWWMTGAYGLGVWPGLAGAVLLLLRRKLAEPVLLLSLLGTTIWFAGFLLVPTLRGGMSSDALLIPLIILALTWTIFWFARHSRMRGWLR
ncbi:MAG: hypothetical protein AVDCRST_MAG31-1208 [uncultured Sphingomonas sp.]|uniref:Uncharacterized protein n=1 Tax=uncultured Sphingomonas sp. TaxID=158754 RepID=A0A6J4T6G1_9SPHN|nr:hypothetical protein [uncultured Sphingomonas sp.]CAA9515098.1 MAG: hypothetical protein AVDCRST_MAG31-1208 [uncultured Sphingomonas sp.]